MAGWAFSASLKENDIKRAWDGDAKSRWSTGTPQQPGQWFQFDMRQPHLLRGSHWTPWPPRTTTRVGMSQGE